LGLPRLALPFGQPLFCGGLFLSPVGKTAGPLFWTFLGGWFFFSPSPLSQPGPLQLPLCFPPRGCFFFFSIFLDRFVKVFPQGPDTTALHILPLGCTVMGLRFKSPPPQHWGFLSLLCWFSPQGFFDPLLLVQNLPRPVIGPAPFDFRCVFTWVWFAPRKPTPIRPPCTFSPDFSPCEIFSALFDRISQGFPVSPLFSRLRLLSHWVPFLHNLLGEHTFLDPFPLFTPCFFHPTTGFFSSQIFNVLRFSLEGCSCWYGRPVVPPPPHSPFGTFWGLPGGDPKGG